MKKLLMKIVLTTALLGVVSSARLVRAENAKSATPVALVRKISFRVNEACSCAQCSFEVYNTLKKFGGVRKIALNVGARRLDIAFDESRHSVSELARALEKLDVGQGSALLWPLPKNADAVQSSTRLSQISGVSSAKYDKKLNVVALTFADKPPVSLAQLDEAAARKGDQ